jgi:hypothetical protein
MQNLRTEKQINKTYRSRSTKLPNKKLHENLEPKKSKNPRSIFSSIEEPKKSKNPRSIFQFSLFKEIEEPKKSKNPRLIFQFSFQWQRIYLTVSSVFRARNRRTQDPSRRKSAKVEKENYLRASFFTKENCHLELSIT